MMTPRRMPARHDAATGFLEAECAKIAEGSKSSPATSDSRCHQQPAQSWYTTAGNIGAHAATRSAISAPFIGVIEIEINMPPEAIETTLALLNLTASYRKSSARHEGEASSKARAILSPHISSRSSTSPLHECPIATLEALGRYFRASASSASDDVAGRSTRLGPRATPNIIAGKNDGFLNAVPRRRASSGSLKQLAFSTL